MKIKVFIQRVIAVILVIVLFLGLQRLVMPKYTDTLLEGSFTKEYYNNASGHQVLMVGDCELYENIDPVTLWNEYGISSYIRGNAEQLTWQSYYMLKEALKYETPDVVVFSVLALKDNEPRKEEYNRLTLDNMKWSMDKWNAINASMTEGESKIEYVFPILRYHSRIGQLTKEDVDSYFKSKTNNTVAGYYMRIDESPYEIGAWGDENNVGKYSEMNYDEEVTDDGDDEEWSAEADDGDEEEWSAEADDGDDEEWSAEADDDTEVTVSDDAEEPDIQQEEIEESEEAEKIEPLGDNAMHYLDLIRELCDEKGIKLLLLKAPSVSPKWYDEWNDQIEKYASKYNLNYINYLDLIDDINIDFKTDTYDGGLHMNYAGAIKCADYLGDYLIKNYNLEDKRSDEKLSSVWEDIKQNQKAIYDLQRSELDKYGEVRSY